MNKIKKNYFVMASLAMMAFTMGACSSDDTFYEEPKVENVQHTCKLIFEGNIDKFDQGTRAATWADNDTIFLIFDNNGATLEAKAIYDATEGIWGLVYSGIFHDTESGTCKAYHFRNEVSTDLSALKMNFTRGTAIYRDVGALFSKVGKEVKVKAHLKPMTGRLRFKGDPGTKFVMHGVQKYTSYTTATGGFTTVFEPEIMIVGSDGYTPYIYGTVASRYRHLWAAYDDYSYTLTCNDDILAAGKSGYLDAPTSTKYDGWRKSKDKVFTINGSMFIMKFVEGGTFTMGGTWEQEPDATDYEKPIHEVTLSDYYIGETEVTKDLWYAVIPSQNSNRNSQAFTNVSWNGCQTLIESLCILTGEKFSLPTEAQWEYAARGGKASNHYKYSGSNRIEDVRSLTINNGVASMKPNELGLYDMSGNATEWCSDWSAEYTADAVTDPVGPDFGAEKIIRGGNFTDSNVSLRVSYRTDEPVDFYNGATGFRLAIQIK